MHELDETGFYRLLKFEKSGDADIEASNGTLSVDNTKGGTGFIEVSRNESITLAGKRLNFVPIWPLSGRLTPEPPILEPIIDKEISLYNKISRRNHLLYGAATYTPVLSSDMTEEEFDEIVNAGLGSWIHIRQGDTLTALETPTAALSDMEKAILAGYEEIAKLGVRMLSPETSQSGVALELRNASQTAQLGTLNTKISNTFKQLIAFMLSWKFGQEVSSSEIEFTMSKDFIASPMGQDWLRLTTEWYQAGLIPRSIWVQMLKHNDMLPSDYDDQKGQLEITEGLDNTSGGPEAKALESSLEED